MRLSGLHTKSCYKMTCENSCTTNMQFDLKCNTFCCRYDIG